jgi:type IV pilus assembly protein PilC
MALFAYTARSRNGQQITNVITSSSQEAAMLVLREQGLLVLTLKPAKGDNTSTGSFSLNPFAYRSINNNDIEIAFHQIAVMLRSGVSLLDALELTQNFSRIGVKKNWQQLIEKIQQGSSFTDALREQKVFTQFTIQLIRVGEQTGHLHTVMDQAATELKSSRKLKKQIVSALKYPAFTLLMAIGIVIFMMVKLIPEIKKLLKLMGKPMPPITKALIDTSDWFMAHLIPVGTMAFFFGIAFIVLYNWYPSRWWIDKLALKIPIFGHIFKLSGTVLFSRAMGLLLHSGVVIVEALETVEKLHVNTYMASRINYAHGKILHGSSLGDAMSQQSPYMPLLIQMVHVGENSGSLDGILLEMTEYHEELLEQAIARLTGMIAPAMTIIVGGIIGFVYAAFLVAMFAGAGGSPK